MKRWHRAALLLALASSATACRKKPPPEKAIDASLAGAPGETSSHAGHAAEPKKEGAVESVHEGHANESHAKESETASKLEEKGGAKHEAKSDEKAEGKHEAKGEPEGSHAKAEPEEKELPVLPPASTEIKDELAHFTTMAACVAQKSTVDPMLSDALLAIGYDTIVQDTCRVLEAAKAHDARRCDAIELSGVHDWCLGFVAKVVGDPDECPWVAAHKWNLGRDPMCVAIAARDKRLCAATDSRIECEAIALRDDLHCADLGTAVARRPCESMVQRWYGALTGGAASIHGNTTEPSGYANVTPNDVHPALAPPTIDLTSYLLKGAVLVQSPGGYRVELAGPLEHGANFLAPTPLAHSRVAVEILVSDETHEGRVENIEVTLAGHGSLATPAAKANVQVKVKHFDISRGGAISIAIDGSLTSGPRGYVVSGEYTTFVRDIVKAEATFSSSAHGPRKRP